MNTVLSRNDVILVAHGTGSIKGVVACLVSDDPDTAQEIVLQFPKMQAEGSGITLNEAQNYVLDVLRYATGLLENYKQRN